MKVYFYHTQDIQMIRQKVEEGTFPPHFLYGATKLAEHDIDVVWHQSRLGLPRWRQMIRNTWKVLACREHFDAVYATHYRGLELLVLLRALRLFRRPIVVWHHQPVITPRSLWREWLGRLFYRGFDRMIFFSDKLIADSLQSPKAPRQKVVMCHWGADIDYYERHRATAQPSQLLTFITTGKELRDFPTLVEAFRQTGAHLDIYINSRNGDEDYRQQFSVMPLPDNIHLHFFDRLDPHVLAQYVAAASCVVVCCKESKYTVGLTTIVEALALGKPIICSRNPQQPVDINAEGCGIAVPYGDVAAWVAAIRKVQEQPELLVSMAARSHALATSLYNDSQCAEEVAQVIHGCLEPLP